MKRNQQSIHGNVEHAARNRSFRRQTYCYGLFQRFRNTRFYSLVLLALCDAKYNSTRLVVEQYGSNNDSRVMINSEMGQEFEGSSFDLPKAEGSEGCPVGELPYYLVGYEIFPLKLWLMHPYPGQLHN